MGKTGTSSFWKNLKNSVPSLYKEWEDSNYVWGNARCFNCSSEYQSNMDIKKKKYKKGKYSLKEKLPESIAPRQSNELINMLPD